MDVKVKRIGEVLIESGLITSDQLEILLDDQKHNPHLNLGEMAAKQFDIPLTQIETVFVDKIVMPSVNDLLLTTLTHELSPFVSKTDFQIQNLSINMDIIQLEIARTVTSLFKANSAQPHQMMPSGKNASTKILGTILLSITISEDLIIQPPDRFIQFSMDESNGSIVLESSKLDGIKHAFCQAIKNQIGLSKDIDLIREDGMSDLLTRYYNS